MVVINLEQQKHIKMVRRIRQCMTSATQCMGSGNEGGYAHWTKKANMLRHDLGKGLGYGKGTTIHLIEGSTTQIKVEEIGI